MSTLSPTNPRGYVLIHVEDLQPDIRVEHERLELLTLEI